MARATIMHLYHYNYYSGFFLLMQWFDRNAVNVYIRVRLRGGKTLQIRIASYFIIFGLKILKLSNSPKSSPSGSVRYGFIVQTNKIYLDCSFCLFLRISHKKVKEKVGRVSRTMSCMLILFHSTLHRLTT